MEYNHSFYLNNLNVVAGNVINQDDVLSAFNSDNTIDGVVIALGGRTKEVGPTMLTDGTRNIIKAMLERNIKRVAVVTSIGTGDSMVSSYPQAIAVFVWYRDESALCRQSHDNLLLTYLSVCYFLHPNVSLIVLQSQAPWMFRILMLTVMKSIMLDKNNQEELFTLPNSIGHDLEYVLLLSLFIFLF